MALGTLKCDTIENDSSQSITVASLVTLDSGKANLSGATFTGDVVLDNESELRLSENDNNGSNFISLKSPASVGTNSTWTLPSDAPNANDFLKVTSVSSNNPTLEWAAISSDSITDGSKTLNFSSNNVQADTHIVPSANNTYDLGTSSLRWRDVYTNDLNLSNEGSQNDVDGTWGSWTIQEGEEDLYLLNRRNGKKYKFNLTEV